jgi:hypothetical protein
MVKPKKRGEDERMWGMEREKKRNEKRRRGEKKKGERK